MCVSRTRICVENIIGALKRKFAVLGKLEMKIDSVPEVVVACTVLFNIYHQLRIIDTSGLFSGEVEPEEDV